MAQNGGNKLTDRSGSKWSAGRELCIAEEKLRQKDLLGTVASDHTGFGFIHGIRIEKARG